MADGLELTFRQAFDQRVEHILRSESQHAPRVVRVPLGECVAIANDGLENGGDLRIVTLSRNNKGQVTFGDIRRTGTRITDIMVWRPVEDGTVLGTDDLRQIQANGMSLAETWHPHGTYMGTAQRTMLEDLGRLGTAPERDLLSPARRDALRAFRDHFMEGTDWPFGAYDPVVAAAIKA